jgi:hypothetical protein
MMEIKDGVGDVNLNDPVVFVLGGEITEFRLPWATSCGG